MELRKNPPKTKAKQKKSLSISKKYSKNAEKIVQLLNENIDLRYENNLLYADKIYDDVVNVGTKKEPIYKNVKRMSWMEEFKDEGNGESVFIERSSIVEIEGEKSDGWRLIKYYKLEDLNA